MPSPQHQWRDAGLCRQADPDAWFPEKGESARPAQAICARCPVIRPCLEHALTERESYGVWGGLTRGQRQSLLRNLTRRLAGRPLAGSAELAAALDRFTGPTDRRRRDDAA